MIQCSEFMRLNDEAAILICDYGKGARPKIPFPYYEEAWTGVEYLVATQFIYAGLLDDGIRTIEDVRLRYDGERRNPWDEPECGHHYARAMSSWSTLIALSGFHYNAAQNLLSLQPRAHAPFFRSFWSTNSGWGSFSIRRTDARQRLELLVTRGSLRLQSLRLPASGEAPSSVTLDDRQLEHAVSRDGQQTTLDLKRDVTIAEGKKFVVI